MQYQALYHNKIYLKCYSEEFTGRGGINHILAQHLGVRQNVLKAYMYAE